MSGKRPREPKPPVSLEVINRHNRHDPRALYRRVERKPRPVKDKPGWFEDRR